MIIFPKRDKRLCDAVFDVWLSRDMTFNSQDGFIIFAKHTKAKKIKYDYAIELYLDNMENKSVLYDASFGRAVAIELGGMVRYVWRSDVLTEEEMSRNQ